VRVGLSGTFSLTFEQASPLFLRLAGSGAILVLSAYVGPRMSLAQLILVGEGLVAVVGLVAVIRWPSLGVLGLIIASLLVPIAIGTGTDSKINAAMLGLAGLAGLWILDLPWRREARFRFSRPMLPLFALGLVATLSFAVGVRPEMPFAETAPLRTQIGGLGIFWLSILAFVVAAHRLIHPRWVRAAMWLFTALGAAYIAGRLLPPLSRVVDRFSNGATDSLFYVWLVAFAFGQAAFNRGLHLSVRLALGVVVLATLYQGFFRDRNWNSGWVPPLAVIAIILCAGAPKVGLPVMGIAGALGGLSYSEISKLLLNSYKQYDILTREAAWSTLVPVMKVNPILGIGPANYYWYTPLYPILGYSVNFNSHNNYVDLFLQTGLLGLLCFVWFAVELALLGWRLRNRVAPGFAYAYVCTVLGALAGTLVAGALGDWFLPFVYNIGFTGLRSSLLGWVFLGSLLVFERIEWRQPPLAPVTEDKLETRSYDGRLHES